MNIITRTVLAGLAIMCTVLLLPGCLITDVTQTKTVNKGGTFTTTLTISEMSDESANPYKGVVMVLAPDDWTFVSGTYNFAGGSGAMNLSTDANQLYGNIDTIIVPPIGMKWFNILSDAAYLHPANSVFETTLNFKVGTKSGKFNIGYAVTENTVDMLKSLNPQDIDNTSSWTDTSMNHAVTVNATGITDKQVSGLPETYSLSMNYPNPFNPSTKFAYSLKESGNVKLTVYDSNGKEVAVMHEGFRPAGNYEVQFDATGLHSGIYYYKIEANNFVKVNKMVLMK